MYVHDCHLMDYLDTLKLVNLNEEKKILTGLKKRHTSGRKYITKTLDEEKIDRTNQRQRGGERKKVLSIYLYPHYSSETFVDCLVDLIPEYKKYFNLTTMFFNCKAAMYLAVDLFKYTETGLLWNAPYDKIISNEKYTHAKDIVAAGIQFDRKIFKNMSNNIDKLATVSELKYINLDKCNIGKYYNIYKQYKQKNLINYIKSVKTYGSSVRETWYDLRKWDMIKDRYLNLKYSEHVTKS